jgi:hypothetical protein
MQKLEKLIQLKSSDSPDQDFLQLYVKKKEIK